MPVTIQCPICDGETVSAFFKNTFDLRDCKSCGHRFTQSVAAPVKHVNSVYSDDYFFAGQAGYTDYLAEEDLLRNRGRRYAEMLNRLTSAGRILDVGAAAGFVLQGFVDAGWTGKGIEPNDRMASLARTRLGLEVLTGMLENLPTNEQYDAVSMIQVLPHFVDPRHAMQVVVSVLKPRGLMLVETWNRSSWTARLLGKSWHEYSPPSVLHWFDPKGVAQLAGQFGLIEHSRGRPSKKISAGHAKSLLKHQLQTNVVGRFASKALDIIPDRLVLPYPAEDLFWMILKKH